MLLSVFPITAYADTKPAAKNLTVTNAIDGVCGSTVELSWQKNIDYIGSSYHIVITRSYDGVNFTNVGNVYSSVNTRNWYTYYTVDADKGKKVYFGVQYEMSDYTYVNPRATVSVNIKGASSSSSELSEEEYKEKLLQGLADPSFKKTTTNYNGNTFVKGTKVVWDCKLYTLTATATAVSGKKVTFDVKFDTKIPYEYLQSDGWHDYEITLYANGEWETYRPTDKMKFTVDTSKSDGYSDNAATGMQYFRILVNKNERNSVFVYSSSPYYANIEKNRDIYPGGGYFNEFWISDTYALGYSIGAGFKMNSNAYAITKNSITLGTYSFATKVNYRVKGARSWSSKTFAKNKAMKLTGLKANTVYEIQPFASITNTDPETGKKKSAYYAVSNAFTLTTSIASAPQVTSVKISGVKYGKQTINGYWQSNGIWHPTETFNTASYTITVTVKNVPKNAKGLRMKTGGAVYYTKGNKKTYTFKVTYRDKKKVKGKKISTSFSWSSNSIGSSPLGISPGKSASYKIKNGTYKVK